MRKNPRETQLLVDGPREKNKGRGKTLRRIHNGDQEKEMRQNSEEKDLSGDTNH